MRRRLTRRDERAIARARARQLAAREAARRRADVASHIAELSLRRLPPPLLIELAWLRRAYEQLAA